MNSTNRLKRYEKDATYFIYYLPFWMGVVSGINLFKMVYTGQNFVMGLKIWSTATAPAMKIQLNPNSLASTIDPIFKSPTIP